MPMRERQEVQEMLLGLRGKRAKILPQYPESRAEKIARCTRTLTFILSLSGRGDTTQPQEREPGSLRFGRDDIKMTAGR
jgi:hypothetical protein